MLEIDIPGYKKLMLEHMVLDYNGTLAVDGELVKGVDKCLKLLSKDLMIHVVTADTFGKAASGLKDIPMELTVLPKKDQAEGKLSFVRNLGVEKTVAIGNGRNDRLMIENAALGIAVILDEGASGLTLQCADVVTVGILSALELFINPLRLTATLRS